MENLAITPLEDLDNLSSTYFSTETNPKSYMNKLARNFAESNLPMPQGTSDDPMSSKSLIKCHTAWLWHSSKTDAASSLRYYNKLIDHVYNRAIHHDALKIPAMDATNQNEYWKCIGGSGSDKEAMVTAALTVTTMFKGEGNSEYEQKLWDDRLIKLLNPSTH